MNVKRFVGKNAREAMAQARAVFGDQAVILSNRPVPGGVEILAMEGADVPALPAAPARAAAPTAQAAAPAQPEAPAAAPMSTVSFQEFVRERQRQEAMQIAAAAAQEEAPAPVRARAPAAPAAFVPAAAPHCRWSPRALRRRNCSAKKHVRRATRAWRAPTCAASRVPHPYPPSRHPSNPNCAPRCARCRPCCPASSPACHRFDTVAPQPGAGPPAAPDAGQRLPRRCWRAYLTRAPAGRRQRRASRCLAAGRARAQPALHRRGRDPEERRRVRAGRPDRRRQDHHHRENRGALRDGATARNRSA